MIQHENNSKIESSREYDKFKNLGHNRKNGINKSRLKELISSIKENNYLHLHPIIVDDNFTVIDGQHRLRAAKDLNLPIFYIQQSNISERHVMNANTAQSSWSVDDIINFFAVKDRIPSYVKLQEVMKSTNLKPKGVFGLLFGICNTALLDTIKRGSFKFPTNSDKIDLIVNNYLKFITFVEDRRLRPRSMFSNSNFTQAFRLLVLNDTFQMDVFLKKLENRWFDLKPQMTPQNYFNLLIEIYNWHNRGNKINDEISWES